MASGLPRFRQGECVETSGLAPSEHPGEPTAGTAVGQVPLCRTRPRHRRPVEKAAMWGQVAAHPAYPRPSRTSDFCPTVFRRARGPPETVLRHLAAAGVRTSRIATTRAVLNGYVHSYRFNGLAFSRRPMPVEEVKTPEQHGDMPADLRRLLEIPGPPD